MNTTSASNPTSRDMSADPLNPGSELVGSGVARDTWHCIRADRVFLSGTNDVVVRARFRHLRTC